MSYTKRITVSTAYAEKRSDLRRSNPTLVITIDEKAYPTMDWSLGGVLVSSYLGERVLEEEIEGSVRLETASESHPFKGEVVRRDLEDGQMAFRFTELSDSAFTLLERAFVGRRL